MSFYVLEIAYSFWKNGTVVDATPIRLTWEDKNLGKTVCNTFIKKIIEEFKPEDIDNEIKIGCRFYKYKEFFDFSKIVSPTSKPIPLSEFYVPSINVKDININKIVIDSLDYLER